MALSSSSLLHLTYPKPIFGSSSSSNYCILPKRPARSGANSLNRRRGICMASATTKAIEAVRKQDCSPRLMLPPEFEDGRMTYKFYNISENKVETHYLSDVIIDLGFTCCRGSSHGWLALLFPKKNDTFILYNPITSHHIELPSICNLPKLPDHDMDVSKLILTCSPDEENCLAFMINGWENALSFCRPGRSKEWTLMWDGKSRTMYDDCVYSSRLKLFFVLTNDDCVETWDLRDPSSPKLIKEDKCYFYTSLESHLRCLCVSTVHLVDAGEDILYVIRYMMDHVGPDGPDGTDFYSYEGCLDNYPYMTVRFDVLKYDPEKGDFKYVDSDSSSLGGLAIFVGILSHSVAFPATKFKGLKPDSIYFTDGHAIELIQGYENFPETLWGHDIGIYNYRDKTISPCYYPCDVQSLKTITPPPVWFFPSSTI